MVRQTDRMFDSLFSRFLSDRSGATAVEYCFLAVIALAIALTVYGVGDTLAPIFASFEGPLRDY